MWRPSLARCVFGAVNDHTGPFLGKKKKDLNWKSFGLLLRTEELPVREGEKQDCSLLEFFFFLNVKIFDFLYLLIDSNQLNITRRLSLYWKKIYEKDLCRTVNAQCKSASRRLAFNLYSTLSVHFWSLNVCRCSLCHLRLHICFPPQCVRSDRKQSEF